MHKLLLATHNKAKIADNLLGLKPLVEKGVKVVTLTDLNITVEPEETGKTFKENALLKAKFYASIAKMPAIADDGGLTIDALGGEPGVESNRWLGKKATDEELIAYTQKRMKDVPNDKRTAYMNTTLCFYDPCRNISVIEYEKAKGHIANDINPDWRRGYPYRALFIIDRFNKYYDDLTLQEHHLINQRFIAMKRLISKIENYLLE